MNLFNKKKNTQRVFLDYASTTPIDKKVLEAMGPFYIEKFFNPSSIYKEGVEIKNILKDTKESVARILHARKTDIYFTGSGTEANNLAILGLFKKYKKEDFVPHFIFSNIEHPSILEVAKEIEKQGGEFTLVEVNEEGLINPQDILAAIKENTVLVSVMYANSEIGTVQNIPQISRLVKKYKTGAGRNFSDYPFIHTDASQAPNYLDINCERLGVDMMTLDGSKIYGPKGIGCLYKKHSVGLEPIIFGGGQEEGLRSGTENISNIIGFTKALEIAVGMREKESERLKELRDYFIDQILEKIPNASLNGSKEHRLPNNTNVCIPGINAEFEVIRLDEKGIACAYTTACKTLGDESKSYVVEALGKMDCAGSSLRFTFGRHTTKKDIDLTLQKIGDNFLGK